MKTNLLQQLNPWKGLPQYDQNETALITTRVPRYVVHEIQQMCPWNGTIQTTLNVLLNSFLIYAKRQQSQYSPDQYLASLRRYATTYPNREDNRPDVTRGATLPCGTTAPVIGPNTPSSDVSGNRDKTESYCCEDTDSEQ